MKYLIIALLLVCTVAGKAQHSDTIAKSHWAQGAWTYKRNATDTIGIVLYMQYFYVQQPVDGEPYPDIYGASTFFSTNDFVHPDKWDTPIRFFMKGYAGDAKEVVLLACNDFGGTATITVTYLTDGRVRIKTTEIKNGMTPLPSGVYTLNNNLPINNYTFSTCEVNPYE